MGDDAIQAIIGGRRRHYDHFALGLGEAGGFFHQRIVIGEEGAEFVGTASQRQEHIGHET